jgi:anti-sigma B factor antagonist
MLDTKITANTLDIKVCLDSMDASNADDLKAALKELDTQGKDRIVLHLDRVSFIDSSGIGAILSFYKLVNQALILSNPSATVMCVLELLRLHRVFEIEHT